MVPGLEFEEHFTGCAGSGEPRRIIRTKLECRCGRSFTSRERIRKHIKHCHSILERAPGSCQECGTTPEVLVRGRRSLCPECMLRLAEHEVLGVPVLSMAGERYVEAALQAGERMLKRHRAESLEELGIEGMLILTSPSAGWSCSGGVLVFTTCQSEGALRHFRLQLPGELLRVHLRRECWGWSISPGEPRSPFESRAAELAERLMLTIHATSTGASEVLEGELLAAEELLSSLPPPSREHFITLSCEERFAGVSELSFRVAQMEHLLVSGAVPSLRGRCLSAMRDMHKYVDAGGGAALVTLFRTAFTARKMEMKERVSSLIRGFDVWAKHEELGLF